MAKYTEGISTATMLALGSIDDIIFLNGNQQIDTTIYRLILCERDTDVENSKCENGKTDNGELMFNVSTEDDNEFIFDLEFLRALFPTDPRNNPTQIEIILDVTGTYEIELLVDPSDENGKKMTATHQRGLNVATNLILQYDLAPLTAYPLNEETENEVFVQWNMKVNKDDELTEVEQMQARVPEITYGVRDYLQTTSGRVQCALIMQCSFHNEENETYD
eukprot:UN31696